MDLINKIWYLLKYKVVRYTFPGSPGIQAPDSSSLNWSIKGKGN